MSDGTRRVTSRRALRVTAWASAAAAFAASWGVLGILPKPAAPLVAKAPTREVVIVRRILRRVIVQRAAAPATPPVVTFAPAPSVPSAPPTTSTGGSAP